MKQKDSTKNNALPKKIEPETIAPVKYLPIRPIIIWPAPMLAASRTDRVTGRKKTLKVSTKTRKGFKAAGAPEGKK